MNDKPKPMADVFVVGCILGEEDEGGLKIRFEPNTTISMTGEAQAGFCDKIAEMFHGIAEKIRKQGSAPMN